MEIHRIWWCVLLLFFLYLNRLYFLLISIRLILQSLVSYRFKKSEVHNVDCVLQVKFSPPTLIHKNQKKLMISIFPSWTFHSYVATFQQHLHMAYKSLRACASYQDSLDRGLLITWKILNQGFLLVQLKSSHRKFYGRHHDRYWISVSQMTPLWCCNISVFYSVSLTPLSCCNVGVF